MENKTSPPVVEGDGVFKHLGFLSALFPSLGWPKATKYLSRACAGIILAKTGFDFIKSLKKSTKQTSISIYQGQSFYSKLEAWLAKTDFQYSGSEFEFLDCIDNNGRGNSDIISSQTGKPKDFQVIPSKRCHTTIAGIKVFVEKEMAQTNNNNQSVTIMTRYILLIDSINPKNIKKVLNEIDSVAQSESPICSVYFHKWHWRNLKKIYHKREVILPNNQFDFLCNDLQNFFNKRDWYEDVGIPWRRSYLLHGLSGAGKSTTVQALSSHFGLNVYIINLNNISDDDLMSAIADIPIGAILLLEDVDAAFNKRDGKETKVTFSGLLNILDGIVSPEGRVTFMTTNHIDKLDTALIRPGRADIKIEYIFANFDQIFDLSVKFGYNQAESKKKAETWSKENLSMAEVQNRLLINYKA